MTNEANRAAEVLAKFIAAQKLPTAGPLTNNQKISGRILIAVSNGATVAEALDSVCGAGSYARLANLVYKEARA